MRILFPVVLGLAAAASAHPSTVPVAPVQRPILHSSQECPEASRHFARRGGEWSGGRIEPRKLAELPPADAYAAVYRHDERGCMVPVLFRNVRR